MDREQRQRVARRLQITQKHLLACTTPTNLQAEDCCGIVGYVGKDEAYPYLLEGLKILESRGYDSAGITTINHDSLLVTSKFASEGTTSDAISRLKGASEVF